MKTTHYRINRSDLPILADHILSSYKQDLSYFGNNTSPLNIKALNNLEEKIQEFSKRLDTIHIDVLTTQEKEDIEKLLGNFKPLLKNTAHYIHKNSSPQKQAELNPLVADIEFAFHKKNIREIQQQSVNLVRQFEQSMDQLIDLGFVQLLLREFKIMIKNLNNLESDLTEQHLRSTNDYLREEDNQLIQFLEKIIESSPLIFAHKDLEKTEAYAIEKYLMIKQLDRNEIH